VHLIPALDLRGGGVVRLERGDFGRERRYEGDPARWLDRFAEAGARLVHLVDLDASRNGAAGNAAAIARLLGRGVGIQVAGGIRTLERARAWLERGAARVVVGTAAAERPDEVAAWAAELGARRVVVALDVRRDGGGERRLAVRGWRGEAALGFAPALASLRAAGLRQAMATAIERDGTLGGPDLELYGEARALAPDVAWQASGGVRDSRDLEALAHLDVSGAIVGRALLDGRIALTEIGRWWRNGSSPAST
jgi:phosphoribosylformimino-5-aminoimidazole carboxamide ribotide isomerase